MSEQSSSQLPAVRQNQTEIELREVKRDLENLRTAVDRVVWLCRKYAEVAGHDEDGASLLTALILSEIGDARKGYIPF